MDNYADELDELWASTARGGGGSEEAAAVGGGAGTWTPSDPVTHCLINAKPTPVLGSSCVYTTFSLVVPLLPLRTVTGSHGLPGGKGGW